MFSGGIGNRLPNAISDTALQDDVEMVSFA